MHKMHLAHHELESEFIINIIIVIIIVIMIVIYMSIIIIVIIICTRCRRGVQCSPLGSHLGVPSCSLLHTYAWTPPMPDSSEWLPETHVCDDSHD